MTDAEFERRVNEELLPVMKGSSMIVSIIPRNGIDVKFAVELGISVMLDKPIIAVVQAGAKIPEKLSRVVDEFVELDFDDPDMKTRMQECIEKIADKVAERLKNDTSHKTP